MTVQDNPTAFKVLSVVFLVSLFASLFVYFFLPRLLAESGQAYYNPGWVPMFGLCLGLVSVVTVPFAWRWLYRRRDTA